MMRGHVDPDALLRRRIGAILALDLATRLDELPLARIATAQRRGTITREQAIGIAAAVLDNNARTADRVSGG